MGGLSGPAGGAPASNVNETQAALLQNVTSAGDAGGRSDHFLGNALAAAWTQDGAAPSAAAVVLNSSLSFESGADNTTHYTRPYTPSGICRVEVRLMSGGDLPIGFFIKDAAAGWGGNGIYAQLQSNIINLLSLDAGVLTARQSAAVPSDYTNGKWCYVALESDGAQNWKAAWSPDRARWLTSPTYQKVFGAAKLGFSLDRANSWGFFDFVDVVL